jgi:multicopper oxidase
MKRRHFLRLAVSVAAGAGASHAAPLPAFRNPQCSLRMKPLLLEPGAGNLFGATLVAFHGEPVASLTALAKIRHAVQQPLICLPLSTRTDAAQQQDAVLIEVMLARLAGTQNPVNHWLVNGEPVSQREPLLLTPGRRYRLRWINATDDAHLIHLQDHRFQITRMQQTPVLSAYTDTIHIERYAAVDAEVVVREPGIRFS